MTLAYGLKLRDPDAQRFSRIVEITLDNSYVANGYPITAKDLGFGSSAVIEAVIPLQPVIDGYFVQWDDTNSKLKFFQCAGAGAPATELAGASGVLNNKKVRVLAYASGQQL